MFFRQVLVLSVFCGIFSVAAWAAEEVSEGYLKQIRVEPLLKTTTDAAGQPLQYPQTDHPQITAVRVKIPAGAETGWHKHPFPARDM